MNGRLLVLVLAMAMWLTVPSVAADEGEPTGEEPNAEPQAGSSGNSTNAPENGTAPEESEENVPPTDEECDPVVLCLFDNECLENVQACLAPLHGLVCSFYDIPGVCDAPVNAGAGPGHYSTACDPYTGRTLCEALPIVWFAGGQAVDGNVWVCADLQFKCD